MEIKELLEGRYSCECGMNHVCPIKKVVIGKEALKQLTETAEGYSHILLVADGNTYEKAGEAVCLVLGEKIKRKVIFNGSRLLVPDERAVDGIINGADDKTDLILGVGSGVINDLCKYSSFKLGLPYQIVATAPSMDGYASVGAALILDGMKVTLNARVPEAIIADTSILAAAPMDMILSGYGDIIGKYSCLSDWELAALVRGEHICSFVLEATYGEVRRTRECAGRILQRDEEAIGVLTEALVAVGILMAYVGSSRPASGSEHHYSHFFEIVGIERGEKYLPHGLDVFYSSVATAEIREKLIGLNGIEKKPAPSADEYEKEIRRIYGRVANEVLALQEQTGLYRERDERLSFYKDNLDAVKAVLKKAPCPEEMKSILSEVGLSYEYFTDYYGMEKLADARLFAKDLKDRYTVLWMYYDVFA